MAQETEVQNEAGSSPKAVVVTVPASALPAMEALTTGTGNGVIETPHGMPNIRIKVLDPLMIISVRALRTFIQTMLGVITAGPATGLIPAHDFKVLFLTAASVSVGAAVVSILQNAAEFLTKLDQSHPTFTA